jgi:hypothetical protein
VKAEDAGTPVIPEILIRVTAWPAPLIVKATETAG